ncbi:MAG: hypothetical protein MJE77_00015 [Proteobacteria bacterium]|nr:hypothetical protein [Pseudomonadota bacterium]
MHFGLASVLRLPARAALISGLAGLFGLCALPACDDAQPFIESTTVLSDTTDTVGPYVVQSIIVNAGGDDIVELRYFVDDQSQFIPLLMQADQDGERHEVGIPGRPAGSTISYYVTVLRDGARVADDPGAGAAQPYQFNVLSPD